MSTKGFFHHVLTVYRFVLTIPVPQNNGEVPNQRVDLLIPRGESEPRFKALVGAGTLTGEIGLERVEGRKGNSEEEGEQEGDSRDPIECGGLCHVG